MDKKMKERKKVLGGGVLTLIVSIMLLLLGVMMVSATIHKSSPVADGTVFADEIPLLDGGTSNSARWSTSDLTLQYSLDTTNHTASVKKKNAPSGAVTIPSAVRLDGYPNTFSVTSIGDSAFSGCSGLTSITIPSSVTSIGSFAFDGCTGLTSITIPSSVTSISTAAFRGCTGLTIITIPSSVTSIDTYTFQNCTGLTSITIPSSVTSIGNYAFLSCTSLMSITIPSSVTSIGTSAFSSCSGLVEMWTQSSQQAQGLIVNSKNAWKEYTSNTSTTGGADITALSDLVSDGTTWKHFIKYSATPFILTLNADETLENKPFWTLSNSNKTATKVAVNGAIYGELPELSDGVEWINTTSASVVRSNDMIANTGSLIASITEGQCGANAYWNFGAGILRVTGFGGMYDYGGGETPWYGLRDVIRNLQVATDITRLGMCSFAELSQITSFTFSNELTTIGRCAFSGCTSLATVTFGKNITSVEDYAFEGCGSLGSAVFKDTVDTFTLGTGAFWDCSSLTHVTLPSVTTAIADDCFCSCTSLVDIMGLQNVTFVGDTAFWGCSSLVSCDGYIERIVLTKVGSLGLASFGNCTSLTRLELGEQFDSFDTQALDGCSSLTDIYIYNTTPPAVEADTFGGCTALVNIWVPNQTAVTAYQSDSDWSAYSSKIKAMATTPNAGVAVDLVLPIVAGAVAFVGAIVCLAIFLPKKTKRRFIKR